MHASRGLYSVVQYVPDAMRAESANIGAVLYVPSNGFLQTLWSSGLERVKRCFKLSAPEMARVLDDVRALDSRLQLLRLEDLNEEQFRSFIAARVDRVRLTDPRFAHVEDAAQTLRELYTDIMGDTPAAVHAAARRRTALPAPLVRAFNTLRQRNQLIEGLKVPIPGMHSALSVPYAFRNGKLNLIKPTNLDDRTAAEERLSILGFQGGLLNAHKDGQSEQQLVVVSAGQHPDGAAEAEYKKSLSAFKVKFVPASEASAFADEVERTAH